MSTLTLPTASWWQHARAVVRGLFGDDHEGATAAWQPLTELPPAAVDLDPVVEQSMTGEVLRTVEDELGRWVPDLYDLEPARLFDAVLLGTAAGEPFRTGAVA